MNIYSINSNVFTFALQPNIINDFFLKDQMKRTIIEAWLQKNSTVVELYQYSCLLLCKHISIKKRLNNYTKREIANSVNCCNPSLYILLGSSFNACWASLVSSNARCWQ